MSRSLSCDAIVLATYNVGEADRFCILFTQEHGKIAARASAARRIGSRLGGILLPFHRVQAELREWKNGYMITGARRHPACTRTGGLLEFLAAAEMIELLLILLEEGEPLPELFESVTQALQSLTSSPLPHTVRILHLLGHMPSTDMPHFSTFGVEEKRCVEEWILGKCTHKSLPSAAESNLSTLCESILNDHVGRKQKVPGIKRAMTLVI